MTFYVFLCLGSFIIFSFFNNRTDKRWVWYGIQCTAVKRSSATDAIRYNNTISGFTCRQLWEGWITVVQTRRHCTQPQRTIDGFWWRDLDRQHVSLQWGFGGKPQRGPRAELFIIWTSKMTGEFAKGFGILQFSKPNSLACSSCSNFHKYK